MWFILFRYLYIAVGVIHYINRTIDVGESVKELKSTLEEF